MTAPARRPPWWRWFEPPRWFPEWLHLLTCTFCRDGAKWARRRGARR